jgi:copper(I)-binding protein
MRTAALALLSLVGLAASALAADMAKVGDIRIHQPWVRASLGNAPNSAAYMTLETTASEADRLVGGSTPAADSVQLHSHIMEDGIAKMRPVDAIEVAPGGPTVLEPGGLHMMLVGLTGKLEEGGTMPLTLEFETAGEVTLEVPIRGIGAGTMEHDSHDGSS